MWLFKKVITWIRKLPSSWVRANVHSSLLFTLGLLIIGLYVLSNFRPGLAEFWTLTLSLPVIWVLSLAVRIAAQHLAIGADSLEFETRLGPTGNLSTDYEFLRPSQVLRYSLAGQIATFFLVGLGLVVSAVSLPANDLPVTMAALLDIHGGWTSQAWATQIFWVNLLIAALNLLPTIPFDNRALLYSFAQSRKQNGEAAVLRNLAAFDSHLACALIGCGLTILGIAVFAQWDTPGWYALVAAGVYLMVASRWEIARAVHLEQQWMTLGTNAREHRHSSKSHVSRHHRPTDHESHTPPEPAANTALEPSGGKLILQERRMHVSEAYLDEILRKLHREGAAALSVREQEALLTASQKLKEKHRTR